VAFIVRAGVSFTYLQFKEFDHKTSLMRTFYMLRNTFLSVLTVLAIAVSSRADVTISSTNVETPGLAGFHTFTVTATSTDPITAIDFVGDGGNDPATGRGFFGPLNQLTAAGMPTPFQDFNLFLTNPAQDSQFSVVSGQVVVPAGLAEESATHLQAAWAWSSSPGNTVNFAQLVIPDAAAATVNFRGAVTALVGGVQTDFPVSGMIGLGPVGMAPVIAPVALGEVETLGTIMQQLGVSAGDAPITWSGLTPSAGSPAAAATLSAEGLFSWDPAGSARGPKGNGIAYSWTATATNATGADTRVAISLSLIPEPATVSLFGLAMVALVGCFRKR
jgi:hypothetical protein